MARYHSSGSLCVRGQGASSFPRWLRKPAVYLLAILIVASAALFSGAPRAAAAYDCPKGRVCHFVHIGQTKKMRWNAYMVMYNADTGEKVHEWQEKHGYTGSHVRGGAYVLWWWNLDPATTNIRIEITIDYMQNFTYRYPVTWYYKGWHEGIKATVSISRKTFSFANGQPDARLDPGKNHCFMLDPDSGLRDVLDEECAGS
jgi:hypothetical protein